MRKHDEIINLYFQSMELFRSLESTPRDFGSGDLLYKSEVHTLTTIGYHPGINLTELSLDMNVSKSAISKFIKKLLDKNLILKSMEKDNRKEVVFYLTQKGQIVFTGHEAFAESTFSEIYELLNSLSQDENSFLTNFFKELIIRIKASM